MKMVIYEDSNDVLERVACGRNFVERMSEHLSQPDNQFREPVTASLTPFRIHNAIRRQSSDGH